MEKLAPRLSDEALDAAHPLPDIGDHVMGPVEDVTSPDVTIEVDGKGTAADQMEKADDKVEATLKASAPNPAQVNTNMSAWEELQACWKRGERYEKGDR